MGVYFQMKFSDRISEITSNLAVTLPTKSIVANFTIVNSNVCMPRVVFCFGRFRVDVLNLPLKKCQISSRM